jgi:hypothetical protein
MRVLVIEDDAMLGGALLAALSGEGMSVDWVRDGTDAEAALSDSGYAIVLLDLAPALRHLRRGNIALKAEPVRIGIRKPPRGKMMPTRREKQAQFHLTHRSVLPLSGFPADRAGYPFDGSIPDYGQGQSAEFGERLCGRRMLG